MERSCRSGGREKKSLEAAEALLSPRSVIQRGLVPSISLVLETELEQRVTCLCVCCMSKVPLVT